MTPEEYAKDICHRAGWTIEPWVYDIIVKQVRTAIAAEREACALACDAIAGDKHAQYKGHAPHAPNNNHRADTYTEGESSGSELCAAAIRARTEGGQG